MSLRVGTDLVSVADVDSSLTEHAERYLDRVYTSRERADCTSPQGIEPQRLAARFAAKEATLKVLRPDDVGVPWTSIEVRRDPGGWVTLALSGVAARLAERAGIEELALSISHEREYASAVVIAGCALQSTPGETDENA